MSSKKFTYSERLCLSLYIEAWQKNCKSHRFGYAFATGYKLGPYYEGKYLRFANTDAVFHKLDTCDIL